MGRGNERTEADKMRALLRPQAPRPGDAMGGGLRPVAERALAAQAEESEGAGPLQGDTSRRRGPEDARRLGRRESRWTWRGPGRGVWASSLG